MLRAIWDGYLCIYFKSISEFKLLSIARFVVVQKLARNIVPKINIVIKIKFLATHSI